MKELYNNVDYDYPACGGIIIKQHKSDRVSITWLSNHQGCVTGQQLLLSTKDSQIIKNDIDNQDFDGLHYYNLDYEATKMIRKGYIVQ